MHFLIGKANTGTYFYDLLALITKAFWCWIAIPGDGAGSEIPPPKEIIAKITSEPKSPCHQSLRAFFERELQKTVQGRDQRNIKMSGYLKIQAKANVLFS